LVVIAGGVSDSAPLFLDSARQRYAEAITGVGNRRLAEVRTTRLGAAGALIGAATLAAGGAQSARWPARVWHAEGMGRVDGDEFVRCACGLWHWGAHGAAGLLVHHPRRGVLLQRRAGWVHHGHTWALPGGAVRGDETPAQGAAREAAEEADVDPALLHPVAQVTEDHHTWRYTTVLAVADPRVRARAASSESAELRWVDTARVEEYPLHQDFGAAWPTLLDQLGRKLVVIVDTASVPPTAEPWAAVENPWTDTPVSAAALGLTPPRPDRRHWAW